MNQVNPRLMWFSKEYTQYLKLNAVMFQKKLPVMLLQENAIWRGTS